MRLPGVIRFPTLVLTAIVMVSLGHTAKVYAANGSPSPDFIEAPPAEKPLTNEQRDFKNSTDIAPQPPAAPEDARRLGYFHKYRKGLSFLGAYVYDLKHAKDSSTPLFRESVLFLFQDEKQRPWEVGADILSDGSGSLSLARRFIYSRDRFWPYTKAGLAVRVEPSDQLATFLRYRYYRIFGAAGFEQLIKDPISFRLEAQVGASTESIEGSVSLGLVWSW